MTVTNFEYPQLRDESPWAQPIAWRFTGNEGLEQQIADPTLSHLVREVVVKTRRGFSGLELSPNEVRTDLELVDEQFRQLEALTELKVVPVEWHISLDERGLTRTLARVPIIDGYDGVLSDIEDEEDLVNNPELSPEVSNILRVYLRGLDTYYRDATGRRLDDIDRIGQFKYGAPRVVGQPSLGGWSLYLVDIEPALESQYPPDSAD